MNDCSPYTISMPYRFSTHGDEDNHQSMKIDDYLIPHPSSSYLLRAKSDSMTEVGILRGDFLVVEKGVDPKKGDIIIIEEPEGFSMKFFEEKPMKVLAVVKGVFRKYGQ